jgi:hypothetical protein
MNIIQKIEQEQLKPNISSFKVGDTVRVHTRVVEGDKERIPFAASLTGKASSVFSLYTRRVSPRSKSSEPAVYAVPSSITFAIAKANKPLR